MDKRATKLGERLCRKDVRCAQPNQGRYDYFPGTSLQTPGNIGMVDQNDVNAGRAHGSKSLDQNHYSVPGAVRHTFEIRFAQVLPLDAREEVVLRLLHQRGISGAVFVSDDPTRLSVHADPTCFSAVTLRDFIRGLWVGAELADD